MSKRVSMVGKLPIIFGNVSQPITKDKSVSDNKATHKWTVYVRSPEGKCLSPFLKQVVFVLHSSFANHRRVVTESPFSVTEVGWGEFDINIELHFVDAAEEPPVIVTHFVRLFLDQPVKSEKLTKKPVISEQAEELIFINPTEQFALEFSNARQPQPCLLPPLLDPALGYYANNNFTMYEQMKMEQLREARLFVRAQIANIHYLSQQLSTQTEMAKLVDKLQTENQLPVIANLPSNQASGATMPLQAGAQIPQPPQQ